MLEQFIQLLKYILVAIVQGVAEILPISSSGHMVIVQDLLGLSSSDLTFEVFLHFASLLALLVFFRKKLWNLISHFFTFLFKRPKITEESSEEEKEKAQQIRIDYFTCWYLVLATIPAAIVGLLLNDLIEGFFSNMLYVGILLIINAGLLFTIKFFRRNKETKDMTWKEALVTGAFQCLGIFPGISRSGSCIVGASTMKMKQDDAAEFAFLMGIPMFLGTTILKVGDIATLFQTEANIAPLLVSFVVTAVVTYFSLAIFLKMVRKQKLSYFSIYCLVVGVTSIVLYFVL